MCVGLTDGDVTRKPSPNDVVLPSLRTSVFCRNGQSLEVNVLFDSGSLYSFVSQSVVDALKPEMCDDVRLNVFSFVSHKVVCDSFPRTNLSFDCYDHELKLDFLVAPFISVSS